MAWELVEGNKNFWNPEKEGEELIGKISEIADGMYGKRYTLEMVKDGKTESITLPSHKVLTSRLQNCALNDNVKVVFKGTLPAKVRGERPTMLYEVFREKAVTEEKVQ
jgi:hypothetical protein